jgi:hypothetical protein
MRIVLLRQFPKFDPAKNRRRAPRSYVVQAMTCRIYPDDPKSIHGEKRILCFLRDFSSTGFAVSDFIGQEMLNGLRPDRRYIVKMAPEYFGEDLYMYCRFVRWGKSTVAPDRPGPKFGRKVYILGFEIEQMPLGDEDLAARLM